MQSRTRWHTISEIEVGNATKPIRQLAEHTAERAAIACAAYTTNATEAIERPPKRPRKRTIPSTMYTDIEIEPDAQVPTETVHLSDDSSDLYKDSRGANQTELETEPDAEDDDIPDAKGAGLRHRTRTADKQTNNWVSTG